MAYPHYPHNIYQSQTSTLQLPSLHKFDECQVPSHYTHNPAITTLNLTHYLLKQKKCYKSCERGTEIEMNPQHLPELVIPYPHHYPHSRRWCYRAGSRLPAPTPSTLRSFFLPK